MLRRSLLISAALSVAACAGAPDLAVAPDIDAPETFLASPDATGDRVDDWVAAFGDPRLSALVAEALDANPTVAAAAASLDAAEASARAAGAPRLPSIDASTGVSQTDTVLGDTTAYDFGAEASWQVDVWGRLTDDARAGVFNEEAARADLYGARLSIAGSAAQAWFGLIEARLQTELAEHDVETRARQLAIVERRFERGVARSSDVRTQRSALASTRAGLAARRRAEAAAARRLEALLGRYPGGQIEHETDLPDLGGLPDPGDPEALLTRRPDVVAAESRLAASGFSARAARKALYPGLNLRAAVNSQTEDAGDLFDSDALIESVSASILAPIFRGGALRAERDRAEAVARRQAALYVETALAALREAEDAIYADQTLADRVAALDEARQEAQAALQLVERQYASGVATIFELLDAQSRLISAESQLIAARRERADNRVALHLAIAGDFASGGGVTGINN